MANYNYNKSRRYYNHGIFLTLYTYNVVFMMEYGG